MFTREDLEALQNYEKFFNMVKGGYIRGTTRNDRMELRAIFNKAYPDVKYHYSDSCSTCVFQMYERAKKAYDQAKAYYEEQDKVQEELEPIKVQTIKVNKKKNKATETTTEDGN